MFTPEFVLNLGNDRNVLTGFAKISNNFPDSMDRLGSANVGNEDGVDTCGAFTNLLRKSYEYLTKILRLFPVVGVSYRQKGHIKSLFNFSDKAHKLKK